MKVLYVCTEVFPWLKTGGLADVSAALPPALRRAGVDVRVLVPAFPALANATAACGKPHALPPGTGDSPGPRADTAGTAAPWVQPATWLGDASATPQVYLLHAPGLLDQPGNPYTDANGQPWPDSARRFAWLSWAAAQLGTGLDATWQPSVVHGHDWHTGLCPAYLHALAPALAQRGQRVPPTVFTIHNLAYQGVFGPDVMAPLGLPPSQFSINGLEFHGNVSFMKAGLQYSTALTTVSPTYAREITQPEQGHGLDGLLRHRQGQLTGILNGVDEAVWHPETDTLAPPGYSAADLSGKAAAKAALQAELGLHADPAALLCVVVSRLTDQKGLHLLPQVVDELVQRGGQLAVLGEGDAAIEQALRNCALQHPGRVALHKGYSEALAHRMVAGGDVIMVPSRFEPCGLTQLYGLRYGTLPLVRAVGGLADTVTDCSLENLADGSASGFVFHRLDADDLARALRRAFALYARPAEWHAVQRHAMGLRFDWARAAQAYAALYTRLAQDVL
ncbi:MAG: glycogen synthase GlgA [Burkholderiales bacterium]|nr:glycogen synthase GlgA [Burkholderiales bacterium]